jgi:catalase
MGEYVTDDEEYYTAQIITSAIQLSTASRAKLLSAGTHPADPATSAETAPGYRPDAYRRDVHTKAHGCVLADFTVNSVDERFAYGLFAAPGKYDAVIRYSSGDPALQPDSKHDARGFAVKVLGVPGKKLLDFEQDDPTQDFVLMNNPTFFIRTIDEYARFSAALGQGSAFAYFIGFRNPLTWHLREMAGALGTFKPRPESVTTTRFWSASAYTLGPQTYVKYSAVPCSSNHPMPPAHAAEEKYGFDYLRLELANQAAKGGACYDFMVQPQVLGKNMPIEDTTVEWSEKDSPFIPVARITLKAVPDNTPEMNDRCENLAFNPWHALPAHRPVGAMNRIRKALYQGISQFRRTKNCEPFCRRKCDAGLSGQTCGAGCFEACMSACPLLAEPVPVSADLPPGACAAR